MLLPEELWDVIFILLRDDLDSLRVSRLVCQSWNRLATPHLFHETEVKVVVVYVWTRSYSQNVIKLAGKFLKLITVNPIIASTVVILRLTRHTRRGWHASLRPIRAKLIADMLDNLPNLQELNIRHTCWAFDSNETDLPIRTYQLRKVFLQYRGCSGHRTSSYARTIHDILSLFTAIDVLYINDIPNDTFDLPDSRPAQGLRVATLIIERAPDDLSFFHNASQLLLRDVQSLSVTTRWGRDEFARQLTFVCDAHGQHVKHLEINLTKHAFASHAASLHDLIALQSITFVITRPHQWNIVQSCLDAILASSVASITVILNYRQSQDASWLPRVAKSWAAFAQTCNKFTCLQTVRLVRVESKAERLQGLYISNCVNGKPIPQGWRPNEQGTVRSYLTQLHNRGLLRFD